jgi:hypothetical protein
VLTEALPILAPVNAAVTNLDPIVSLDQQPNDLDQVPGQLILVDRNPSKKGSLTAARE